MSTAQSEFVGYGEGYQSGEAISELLKVVNKPRAWKLREAIQEEGAEWVAQAMHSARTDSHESTSNSGISTIQGTTECEGSRGQQD